MEKKSKALPSAESLPLPSGMKCEWKFDKKDSTFYLMGEAGCLAAVRADGTYRTFPQGGKMVVGFDWPWTGYVVNSARSACEDISERLRAKKFSEGQQVFILHRGNSIHYTCGIVERAVGRQVEFWPCSKTWRRYGGYVKPLCERAADVFASEGDLLREMLRLEGKNLQAAKGRIERLKKKLGSAKECKS